MQKKDSAGNIREKNVEWSIKNYENFIHVPYLADFKTGFLHLLLIYKIIIFGRTIKYANFQIYITIVNITHKMVRGLFTDK